MRARKIDVAVWAAHGALLAAVLLGLATAGFATLPVRLLVAGVAVAPLLTAIPGLARRRRYTQQWLALLLVLYAGVAAVEIVASLGTSSAAAIALLASLLEFALLFILGRQPPPRATRG